MAHEPGWFPDPYGRFQQRYHDGERWTEHVANDGQPLIDPMGASTVVPFALPASAVAGRTGSATAGAGGGAQTATGAAASPGPPWTFLERLGPDAKVRPPASLHTALAGAGGAVAATGLSIAIIGTETSRGLTALAGILVAAAALVIRLFVRDHVEVRAAAVGMGVVGITAVGLAINDFDLDGAGGWLIMAALFVVAWALPGFRGRPIMLGLGALSLVFALVSATSSDRSSSFSLSSPAELVRNQGAVFLLAAAVLFALVWVLDHHGFHGVATSLVVAALISSAIGVGATVAQIDDTGGTLLALFVGLVVCIVGSHGDRRATTWYGALLSTIGLTAFFIAVIEPSSTGGAGAALLVAGVLLVVVPIVIRAVRAGRLDRSNGSGDVTPPPSSSFAPPAAN